MIKKLKLLIIANILVNLFLTLHVQAADFNPPYPRIGQITFYPAGAGPTIWQNHDLVIIRHYMTEDARRIKEKNPDVILLATNGIIDEGDEPSWHFPDEWFAKYADGSRVYDGFDYLMNVSEYCPEVSYGGYPAMKFNEWAAQQLADHTNWNYFDGSFFDSWHNSIWYDHPDQVDYDNNGVADGQNVANQRLRDGNRAMANKLRELSGKPVVAHEAGTFETSYLNGVGEEAWDESNWSWSWTDFIIPWRDNAVNPRINFNEVMTEDGTNYSRVRTGITTSALGDFYVGVDEGAMAHRWTYLYDEYEADLGYPTSDPIRLSEGVWARYFDYGAVIVNGSGRSQTITASQLIGGPYWRFQGNQDPDFNNGEEFTSITLNGAGGDESTEADGILLFKQPATLVTPIIIDNVARNMTTVGQTPVQFSGSWTQYDAEVPDGTEAYALYYLWDEYGHPYAYTAGSGNATYQAQINAGGDYEIYEWHPNIQGGSCSNVNISYSGMTCQEWQDIINQSADFGQWNKVGTCTVNNRSSVSSSTPCSRWLHCSR